MIELYLAGKKIRRDRLKHLKHILKGSGNLGDGTNLKKKKKVREGKGRGEGGLS